MIVLRFSRTPSVQVQVSRLIAVQRLGHGVPRPRGESLPNTPQTPPPEPTTWSFFMKHPTATLEGDEDEFGYGSSFADRFWEFFQQREAWERPADWWKR